MAASGRCSTRPATARRVAAQTTTPPGGAYSWSRAAVVITAPLAAPCPPSRVPARSTSTSPVATPTRIRSRVPAGSRRSSAAWISSPARTPRYASNPSEPCAPNSAITASPTYFSTTPCHRRSTAATVPKYACCSARTSSGSSRSTSPVDPTMSAKSTVTVRRSSGTGQRATVTASRLPTGVVINIAPTLSPVRCLTTSGDFHHRILGGSVGRRMSTTRNH
ncbi:hypothetical protein B0E53_06986 [Micromonospora sp. MH33]|nr:hypothetical protein B0E53_06986 [Micromonospora sp. MH33]